MSELIPNRYILHEKLGEGGTAEVFRATHIHLGREVAIKLIKPEARDTEFLSRFQIEAKAIARLNHPNVLQVYDFDVAQDGYYFMAMEYLPGGDLAAHLAQKDALDEFFTLEAAVLITRSVAEGLHYAHTNRIIHRDVKPSNIYITHQNRVVIGDFGLAKVQGEELDRTLTGSVIGTPNYLSPEQLEGQSVDPRADIYALGIVFFQLLTGRLPFESNTLSGIITKQLNAPIPDPRLYRPDLPPLATTIIQRSLAKNRDNRYPDMQAFINDLNALAPENLDKSLILQGISRPPMAKTIRFRLPLNYLTRAALVSGLLFLIGIAYLLWFRPADKPSSSQTLPVAPAHSDEFLILVAPMLDEVTEIDLSDRIRDYLDTGALRSVLQAQLRIEILPTPPRTEADALQLGRATRANLIIWGQSDAAGWQIMIQAPNHPAGSLNHLGLRAVRTADLTWAEQVPAVTDYYAKILLMSDIIRNNDLYGTFYLIFTLVEFDESAADLPATPLDRQIFDFSELVLAGQGFEADAILSDILRSNPNEVTLYYLRWAANMLIGERELAARESQRLAALSDNDFARGLEFVTYFLFGELDSVLDHAPKLNYAPNSASIIAHAFVYQAAIQKGDFAIALDQMNAHRQWLLDHNTPDAQYNYLDSLVYLFRIQGDNTAYQTHMPDFKDWRESRFYQEGNQFFRELQPDFYAPIAFSQGGFGEESVGQSQIARLTYTFGLANYPDDYLLNWRQAAIDSQNGDYQKAYDRYDRAAENAPVPFPIARYDQARLVQSHPDELDHPRSTCDLLDEAATLAHSDPTFYAALLTSISTLQSNAACS